MARPSVPMIIAGWVCAGLAFPFVLGFLLPGLAGLTALYLLTGALMIAVAPLAHIILARTAVAGGSYSPPRTVAKVAAGIFLVILLLALLGIFNFA
ncbi:MAG: hypothetical protein JWL65_2232 [Gammaproteobacteria bacterium]|nr:hypothetical protein [Gammaproteobacteria bacterium]